VKSGRTKGGPDRERAYWEPPRGGVGQIQGHVEEIEPPDPANPTTRPERVRQRIWARLPASRLAMLAGGTALMAAVAAFNWPAAQPGASPSMVAAASSSVATLDVQSPSAAPTPSATATATPSPTPTFAWPTPGPTSWETPQPEPSDTPLPEPSYPIANGWPFTLQDEYGLDWNRTVVGPDGTVYLDGYPALDTSGRSKVGWLELPDQTYNLPVLFVADGTIYVAEDVGYSEYSDDPTMNQNTELYAFGKNGKLKSGWPVDVGLQPSFELGASGTVIVYSFVDNYDRITVLTPAGKTSASWVLGSGYGQMCGKGVGPDGTMYFAYSEGGGVCSILVYSAGGKRLSKAPARMWGSLVVSPQGEAVAVAYDLQPYGAGVVARTQLAVIGTDGQPLAGWPVAVEGAASDPAFGPDGTIYVTQMGLGTDPSKVLAFTPDGQPVAGWPVELPAGYGPFSNGSSTPSPPIVSATGTVFVAATDLAWMGWVLALDPTGAALPGWPYRLPQPLANYDNGGVRGESPYNPGPILPTATGSRIAIYLVLDGRLDAVGPDGMEVSGWPYVLPSADENVLCWENVLPLPDGGVVGITGDSVNLRYVFFRLAASGTAAH
jgi:hypothetical protein